jgi:hypothetical protein
MNERNLFTAHLNNSILRSNVFFQLLLLNDHSACFQMVRHIYSAYSKLKEHKFQWHGPSTAGITCHMTSCWEQVHCSISQTGYEVTTSYSVCALFNFMICILNTARQTKSIPSHYLSHCTTGINQLLLRVFERSSTVFVVWVWSKLIILLDLSYQSCVRVSLTCNELVDYCDCLPANR